MKTSRRFIGVHSLNVLFAIGPRFVALLLAAFAPSAALWAQSNYATPYTFTTFAGNAGYGSADGTGADARFNQPRGMATDAAGNIFVADSGNNTIRKISSEGSVTTFAGLAGSSGSNDGAGSAALFNMPTGVAVDSAGNVFVADSGNDTIRKITAGGVVTTFAGSAGNEGAADGTGTAARFYQPNGVAVDGAGNVYVADFGNNTIRKITPTGSVTTLAGSATNSGLVDGTGSDARFNFPSGVAVDGSGNVFVADTYNNKIRRITASGIVTTVTTVNININWPSSVAVDSDGNVFVGTYFENVLFKIDSGGLVTMMAGSVGHFGSADGTGSAAQFSSIDGIVAANAGIIYVSDTGNHTIRRIAAIGEVTTIAGLAGGSGSADGAGSAARFHGPSGVTVDGAGNVYSTDYYSGTVRKITPAGVVTTLAGTAGPSYSSIDGIGSAARFFEPFGVAVDGTGNVYVADSSSHTIRKITAAGVVTTFAGTAGVAADSTDGTAEAARFNYPHGIAVDAMGTVYVADTNNHIVRKITAAGVVTTLAGSPGIAGSADGSGSTARFSEPRGIAADNAGNVYVADWNNHTVRKITVAGVVTTLAGSAESPSGLNDGASSAARFNNPSSVAVDTLGNVYVADSGNNRIRKITAAGEVTTLAGGGDIYDHSSTDGKGGIARFDRPSGIAVDATGNLYVADTDNNTIRKGVWLVTTAPTIAVQPFTQAAAVGGSVTFTVVANGSPAPIYQWQKNGINVSGGTGSSYTISNAVSNDAGSYTVIATNSEGSVTSDVATLNVIPAGFDVAGYYARNPDVLATFGGDNYGAWLYYRDHGIYQGEVFDDLFRVEEYLALYPDLSAIFGSDLGAALDHWLSTGRIEGKLGRIPLEFKAQGYFDRNPDVAAAVNNDALLAWGHYWAYGIYEGRAYDDELRVFEYLAINADLTAAFVNDWRQAALHWMRYGRIEGRLGRLPLTFNVTEYLNRSPDVAAVWGTNPTTVFLHFWLYGIDEGRTYDDLFRPDEYLALNPDLAAALGTDRRKAFKHWVRYGITEGRPGRYP